MRELWQHTENTTVEEYDREDLANRIYGIEASQ